MYISGSDLNHVALDNSMSQTVCTGQKKARGNQRRNPTTLNPLPGQKSGAKRRALNAAAL